MGASILYAAAVIGIVGILAGILLGVFWSCPWLISLFAEYYICLLYTSDAADE